MVLSLQGGMAAGKTTAARAVAARDPSVTVFFEDNTEVLQALRLHRWDKHRFEDYCEIQRLFIAHEIRRYRQAARCPCALLDLGADEIEFYTLCYPASIGQDWPVEQALAPELAALRRCMPRRTLFLLAGTGTLRRRKEADASRDRGFFEHTVRELLPRKQAWYAARPNTDFLQTDVLTPTQTADAVLTWLGQCRKETLWNPSN